MIEQIIDELTELAEAAKRDKITNKRLKDAH